MTTDMTKYNDDDIGIDLSDLMMLMMVIMLAAIMPALAASTATATLAAQSVQAQLYQGIPDHRTLHASNLLQWVDLIHGPPYTSWVFATFENQGPSDVEVAVNYPGEMFPIVSGGSAEVDCRGAERRMSLIFYRATPGLTATIVVHGEY